MIRYCKHVLPLFNIVKNNKIHLHCRFKIPAFYFSTTPEKQQVLHDAKSIPETQHPPQANTNQQILEQIKKIESQNKQMLQLLSKSQPQKSSSTLPLNKLSWVTTALKRFGFFGTALLVLFAFVLYGLIWVIQHPTIYRQLKQQFNQFGVQLSNESIVSALSKQALRSQEYWQKQTSPLLKQLQKQTIKELNLNVDVKEYFTDPWRMILMETCKHSHLLFCLLSKMYQMDNFKELAQNQQLFLVQLKRPTEFSSKRDSLKELKILTKYLYDKFKPKKTIRAQMKMKMYKMFNIPYQQQQTQPQKQNICDKVVVIIDNFQILAKQMKNQSTKQDALDIFHKLEYLSNSAKINIIGIGYDCLFKDTIIEEVNPDSQSLLTSTHILQESSFRSIINTMLQQHQEMLASRIYSLANTPIHHQNQDLSPIFQKMKNKISDVQDLVRFFMQLKYQVPIHFQGEQSQGWFSRGQTAWLKTLTEHIQTFFAKSDESKQIFLKSKVFKDNKEESQVRIRLLTKILLNYYNNETWADKDLISFQLDERELKCYNQLCSEQILFYFNFYSEQYKNIFFKILARNKYFHQIFAEYYNQQNHKSIKIKNKPAVKSILEMKGVAPKK